MAEHTQAFLEECALYLKRVAEQEAANAEHHADVQHRTGDEGVVEE